MSSELSNPGSVASKTGEWAVCDRSSTRDMIGPRLPERQHAGWKVSTAESTKEDGVNADFNKRYYDRCFLQSCYRSVV